MPLHEWTSYDNDENIELVLIDIWENYFDETMVQLFVHSSFILKMIAYFRDYQHKLLKQLIPIFTVREWISLMEKLIVGRNNLFVHLCKIPRTKS